MTRITGPECPTCLRRHWELVSTEAASKHCHMDTDRFKRIVAAGNGPKPWTHDVYAFPRFHVAELDRWMAATTRTDAA